MSNPWIQAIRLRTLPLAWATLTMGAALAFLENQFDWVIYGLSIATAFALQILSNLANDYGDAVSGLDGEHRVGPKRTIQNGLISKDQMKRAIIFTGVLSFLLGSLLIYYSFHDLGFLLVFLFIGILAIWAAIRYTIGDNPYGYSGWGDIFVLLFFGWVGVSGSFTLYAKTFEALTLLPATTLGLLAVAVLNVNNIRDIESDRIAGKSSIPVKVGRSNAIVYHGVILILAMVCTVIYGLLQEFSPSKWVFLMIIPLLVKNWIGVKQNETAERLDPYLKQMAFSTLLFVVLFLLGILVSG